MSGCRETQASTLPDCDAFEGTVVSSCSAASAARRLWRRGDFFDTKWQGYRSSRLGLQYRVIYRVMPEHSLFQVVHIMPHDYRSLG